MLRYPDYPKTNGVPPSQWPTAREMTDAHLDHWLTKMRNKPRACNLIEQRGFDRVRADLEKGICETEGERADFERH